MVNSCVSPPISAYIHQLPVATNLGFHFPSFPRKIHKISPGAAIQEKPWKPATEVSATASRSSGDTENQQQQQSNMTNLTKDLANLRPVTRNHESELDYYRKLIEEMSAEIRVLRSGQQATATVSSAPLKLDDYDPTMSQHGFELGSLVSVVRHFSLKLYAKNHEHVLARRTLSLTQYGIVNALFLTPELVPLKSRKDQSLLFQQLSPPFVTIATKRIATMPVPRSTALRDYLERMIESGCDSRLVESLFQWHQETSKKTMESPDATSVGTADQILWEKTVALLKCLVDYEFDPLSTPEEQSRANFWMKIWQELILSWNRRLRGAPEFRMADINPSYTAKHYADYAVRTREYPAPFFLMESAGKKVTGSYQHKDYQKLAFELGGCLLAYIGVFRHHDEVLSLLRCYGCLTGGPKIQFVVVFPIIKKSHNSLKINILQQHSLSHCMDFGHDRPFPVGPECGVSYSIHNTELPIEIEEFTWNSLDVSNMKKFMGNAEENTEEEDRGVEKKNVSSYDCRAQDFNEKFQQKSIALMSICEEISEYGTWLSDNLKSKTLDEPFGFTPEMGAHAPKSRESHSESTPHKRSTPTYSKPDSNTSFSSDDPKPVEGTKKHEKLSETKEFERLASDAVRLYAIPEFAVVRVLSSRYLYRAIMNCHMHTSNSPSMVIVKFKRMKSLEIELLRELRHERSIVHLYNSQIIAPNMVLLHEELLTNDASYNPLNNAELMPVVCGFLVDGCSALNSLTKHGIIHRDISTRNIMWSSYSRCWKLIDFDLSVRADENGTYPVSTHGAVGTDGFLATELTHNEPTTKYYSYQTDLFALMRVAELRFRRLLHDPRRRQCLRERDVADRIWNTIMTSTNPLFPCRPTLLEVKRSALESLAALLSYYHGHDVAYWNSHRDFDAISDQVNRRLADRESPVSSAQDHYESVMDNNVRARTELDRKFGPSCHDAPLFP